MSPAEKAVPLLAAETAARRLAGVGDRQLLDLDRAVTWHGPADYAPDRPTGESVIQALCGLMAVNGRDQGAPRRMGLEVASVAAGMLAAQGVLAAAIAGRRGRPVPGVRTSVLQAGLLLLSHYFVVATSLGDALPGPPLPAPGPPFKSADGHLFEIETLDPESWKDLWTRLGAADCDLGRAWTVFRWRYERATCSLPSGLHETTRRHSLEEMSEVCRASGVSLSPVRPYGDVLHEPGAHAGHPVVSPLVRDGPRARSVAATPDQSSLPLGGIRIVEATSRIQGPFAGMLLRMLGADVVRVQPPEGDYGRAALSLHRRKETVQLDLGSGSGRDELIDLVADADVFFHNWRPGRAEDWGLGCEELSRRNPTLIYAHASGWGGARPGSTLGTDFLVQAYAGVGSGLNPEDEPAFPSRIILSDLFGALVGAEGVLSALYHREGSGGSWLVETSLLAGAMALQAHVLEALEQGVKDGRRRGRPVWGPLDRPLPTASGTLIVSVEDDDAFSRLCRACGVGQGSRSATEELFVARLGAGTAAEWEELLLKAGVPCAVVATDLAVVAADPRLAHLFESIGAGAVPRSPWSFE